MRCILSSTILLAASLAACSSGHSGTTNQRAEALSYARENIACTQDSDCCVVFDMCMNQGYVVSAADRGTVAQLISTADQSTCNGCEPPPIEVTCGSAGFCIGARLACGWDQAASTDHCGKVARPDGGCPTENPLNLKPAPPAKKLQTVIGCGT